MKEGISSDPVTDTAGGHPGMPTGMAGITNQQQLRYQWWNDADRITETCQKRADERMWLRAGSVKLINKTRKKRRPSSAGW